MSLLVPVDDSDDERHGRKKILIQRIDDMKTRTVTFNKRRVGLMKKAMELSILCDCQVAVVIFSGENLHQYASQPMDSMWNRWSNFNGPYEDLCNDDMAELKPGRSSTFQNGPVRGLHADGNHDVPEQQVTEEDPNQHQGGVTARGGRGRGRGGQRSRSGSFAKPAAPVVAETASEPSTNTAGTQRSSTRQLSRNMQMRQGSYPPFQFGNIGIPSASSPGADHPGLPNVVSLPPSASVGGGLLSPTSAAAWSYHGHQNSLMPAGSLAQSPMVPGPNGVSVSGNAFGLPTPLQTPNGVPLSLMLPNQLESGHPVFGIDTPRVASNSSNGGYRSPTADDRPNKRARAANGEPLQIKTTLPSTTAQPVVYTALVSASSHGTGDDDGSDVPVSPDGEAVDQNKGKRSKKSRLARRSGVELQVNLPHAHPSASSANEQLRPHELGGEPSESSVAKPQSPSAVTASMLLPSPRSAPNAASTASVPTMKAMSSQAIANLLSNVSTTTRSRSLLAAPQPTWGHANSLTSGGTDGRLLSHPLMSPGTPMFSRPASLDPLPAKK